MKYEKLTTKLKTLDTFVLIPTTSSFITLSPTGIRIFGILISAATACRLSIGDIIIYETVMQRYKKCKT